MSAFEPAVTFADPILEAAIWEAIGQPTGPIYPSGLEVIKKLGASGSNITDITGLEHCTNLTELFLGDNQISDISPLANLTSLTGLSLEGYQIKAIAISRLWPTSPAYPASAFTLTR